MLALALLSVVMRGKHVATDEGYFIPCCQDQQPVSAEAHKALGHNLLGLVQCTSGLPWRSTRMRGHKGKHGSVTPVTVLEEVFSEESSRAHTETESYCDGGVVTVQLGEKGAGSTEGEQERGS